MFEGIITNYFSKLGTKLSKSFAKYTSGIIDSGSFSTHEIARSVSKVTGKDFNTSEKSLNYLLNNDNFQIDDKFWRLYKNMSFELLEEQNIIRKGQKTYIQVDFTSNKDNFLILCASIIVNNRAIPLYFTMRNYPKRKNQYDHKKMEWAFLKGLKHMLSDKYQYVIVADRGFGNQRFIENCEEFGFEYLIRMKGNINVKTDDNVALLENAAKRDDKYEFEIESWQKKVDIYKASKKRKTWYLASNINGLKFKKAVNIYKNRFKIEKCFQDLKSSGFDIEKSKIRKYANYKRLLAMTCVAHSILVLLGNLISNEFVPLLKKFCLTKDLVEDILAFFKLEDKLLIN